MSAGNWNLHYAVKEARGSLAGAMTSSGQGPQVLSREAFFERFAAGVRKRHPTSPLIHAMYSSLVDGIVTDPDLMVIPLDDHAFLRGHAIFDTATLIGGRVYRLGIHLDRFFASARDVRLPLPFGSTEEENRARITDIVCRTAVASGKRDGSIRFFLSAGPGNFGFTTEGCEAAFYCVVWGSEERFAFEAIKEVTVRSVPMKPPLLARAKTNNYLLNCLTAMAAQDKGGKFGILIRDDGSVAEGCVANVAFVTADRVLVTPEFGDILCGTTVRKAMEVARKYLVGEDRLLRDIQQVRVPLTALTEAVEVIMIAGDTHLYPVVDLDGHQVGDGKVGPVAAELLRLIQQDAEGGHEEHITLEY